MPAITVRSVDWDDPDATVLRAAQRVEIEQRYGRPDSEPGTPPSAGDIAFFAVADLDGAPVACGGLRRIDELTGELKRMYVVPEARGRGASAAVLRALEQRAREFGWARLWLETGTEQPDAVAFYVKHGYARVPCFGAYVEPASLCFGRELLDPGRAGARGPHQ